MCQIHLCKHKNPLTAHPASRRLRFGGRRRRESASRFESSLFSRLRASRESGAGEADGSRRCNSPSVCQPHDRRRPVKSDCGPPCVCGCVYSTYPSVRIPDTHRWIRGFAVHPPPQPRLPLVCRLQLAAMVLTYPSFLPP